MGCEVDWRYSSSLERVNAPRWVAVFSLALLLRFLVLAFLCLHRPQQHPPSTLTLGCVFALAPAMLPRLRLSGQARSSTGAESITALGKGDAKGRNWRLCALYPSLPPSSVASRVYSDQKHRKFLNIYTPGRGSARGVFQI